MGADNREINKWYKWNYIFQLMPIVVFDREDYSYSIFNSIRKKIL